MAKENTQDMTPEVPEAMKRKVQAYQGTLSKMLHGKETSGTVFDMLQSAPPEASIPETALTINGQLEGQLRERGETPSLEIRLAGGVFLVQELIEIGNSGGLWDIPVEEGLAELLEPTMQEYIQAGIKNGTVDPVELQNAVEPLMNEEERSMGMKGMEASGLPPVAGKEAAMETYANQKVSKVTEQNKTQGALEKAQGGQ